MCRWPAQGCPISLDLPATFLRELGVPVDDPAHKVLNEARALEKRTGASGLISADRIFGLLEREFLVRDIQKAVAKALKPGPGVDLTLPRTLLDLATTREGKTRLVTTNVDRLFKDSRETLKIWRPPFLPDPSRPDDMEGIVHLHGIATDDYGGPAARRDRHTDLVRQAWRYIFETWEGKLADFNSDWYELKGLIAKEGWSSAFVRQYGIIKRPHLKVEQNR